MKKSAIATALAIGAMSIGLAFASPQQAVNQVRDNSNQVLAILKKANGKNDAAVRREAENYAVPYFDFDLMTRVAVGAPWNQASEAQKQELVKEHRAMLIRTYSRQMLMYKNAKVDIKSNPVVKNGGKLLGNKQIIEVHAVIQAPGQQPVQAVFSTYQDGGKYKVFNVVFEGAFALIQNQKQQFKPILDAKGIDGLIADLKAKNGGK